MQAGLSGVCLCVCVLSQGDESPIAVVRRRVVRLLGHLGGQLNRSLVTGEIPTLTELHP